MNLWVNNFWQVCVRITGVTQLELGLPGVTKLVTGLRLDHLRWCHSRAGCLCWPTSPHDYSFSRKLIGASFQDGLRSKRVRAETTRPLSPKLRTLNNVISTTFHYQRKSEGQSRSKELKKQMPHFVVRSGKIIFQMGYVYWVGRNWKSCFCNQLKKNSWLRRTKTLIWKTFV